MRVIGEEAGFAFGGGGVARHAETRETALLRLDQGLVYPFWRGQVAFGPEPLALPADHPIFAGAGEAIYLGDACLEDGVARAYFAREIAEFAPQPAGAEPFLDPTETHHPALSGAVFAQLRVRLGACEGAVGEMLATARALLSWHESHRFCARCGGESAAVLAGWKRVCASCGAEHFPRTDPVVIMLVTRGERVLLGRGTAWPEGMYSCLAGFVEPGETLEGAVAREVFEETGVRVGAVRYMASQPWPFPMSLMLGAQAQAVSEAITLDPVELADALWVSRAELGAIFAGEHALIQPPREGAIAAYLLREWLAQS